MNYESSIMPVIDLSKKFNLKKAKEVKKKLDAADLICWSIGSPIGKINITDNFDKHLEKFQYTLEIANILKNKVITYK